ncbi:membrane-associated proteins in eicosanoid and glutathione metabolism [Saccharata proteae CBS 121410]|uniref:Membrane-associated proteins in eicosanoid and glutathione metabolism n=1 Tax=Saccharata proteae CBS 121410 TaxID=1314787 RepID=A0A9P4HRW0_9PEZI|nr:membrane-associated proteins in eicosanoid and glutathione metabolism [Saccharata proteae CBS 121410]
MSLITLQVPQEYGYVLLAASSTLFVNLWHAFRVSPFRRAAGVPYPYQYASAEQIAATDDAGKKSALHLFNCAQRAHYNFLEAHPTAVIAMLISGLRYPTASAVMGGLWAVGRVMYAMGYTRPGVENGKGRLVGSWASLVQIGLMGMAAWTSWKMIA